MRSRHTNTPKKELEVLNIIGYKCWTKEVWTVCKMSFTQTGSNCTESQLQLFPLPRVDDNKGAKKTACENLKINFNIHSWRELHSMSRQYTYIQVTKLYREALGFLLHTVTLTKQGSPVFTRNRQKLLVGKNCFCSNDFRGSRLVSGRLRVKASQVT